MHKCVTSKVNIGFTIAAFVLEASYLSYKHFMSNAIDAETYKTRLKISAFSNTAAFASSSLGSAIGAAIGTFFCPGGGTWIGGLIGGMIGGVSGGVATEY